VGTEPERSRSPTALVEEIAAARPVARALAWAARHIDTLAEEAAQIAAIPAPTFQEDARAEEVRRRFEALGLERIARDEAGNLYGLLSGEGRPALALLAHLDTVFSGDLPHAVTRREGRLYGPGIGDNAAGLAGMIGVVRALRAAGLRPRRPVWLVATVAEEGLGNLRGAIAAVDRLGSEVDAMIAVEGSFFGRLSHVGVGSRRLKVTCRAPGGHSWHDFGRPSAVHALVRVAAAMTCLPAPAEPRTTFNIGRIVGGTGVNVIAEEAELLLDIRSVDAAMLDELTEGVHRLIARRAESAVEFTVREVGYRPAGRLEPEHALVRLCAAVLRRLKVTPHYSPASTDANVPLSRGIPAVTLGITRGGGAHTRAEWIETAPLARGVQQLVLAVMALTDPRAGIAER
jgi:tripeptide aminopeptidase